MKYSIVKDILRQKAFHEVFDEQNEKIIKAKIPYKSKRQRQIEESALRKEAEGATVRQVSACGEGLNTHSLTHWIIHSLTDSLTHSHIETFTHSHSCLRI